MWHVYILKSIHETCFYTGHTNDLNRRLGEHNNGKGIYTSRHLPWKIIYHEEYQSLEAAAQREKYLKSAAGRRWQKKVIHIEQ